MKNSNSILIRLKNIPVISLIMLIAPFFLGLAPDGLALFFTAILSIILVWKTYKENKMAVLYSKSLYGYVAILIGSGLSVFAAVSKGDALIGMIRTLSIGIWLMLLMQYSDEERDKAIHVIPTTAIAMLAASAVLYMNPQLRWFVANGNGRMAGFFQYSNTFALYLLIALMIYAKTDFKKDGIIRRTIYLAILTVGILWTGSRFTLVMFVIALIVESVKDKELRQPFMIVLAVTAASMLVLLLVGGEGNPFTRIFTATSSTLFGRLIYWKDAIWQIARNPLGLGYKGFFLIEPAVQTAPYTVRFVHNELLQTMLDYGWIAGVGFVYMFVTMLKHAKKEYRAAIIILFVHALFDFDFQFLAMCLVATLFISFEDKKSEADSVAMIDAMLVIFAIMCTWVGTASYLSYHAEYGKAYKLYPLSEETERDMMVVTSNESLAKDILEKDEMSGVSYDVISYADKSNSDYKSVLRNKRQALLLQPYQTNCYSQYVDLLIEAEDSLKNDKEYKKMVKEVPELIEHAKENMNPLIYKTVDAPSFELSERQENFLKKYS